MKKLLTLLLVLSPGWMVARENVVKQKNVSLQKIVSGCLKPFGMFDLDIANVRARIFTGGDMWWDLVGSPQYEIPKGSGKHSMFSGAIWMGGYDANGNLKVAAQTYRQGGGNDYFAGPTSTITGVPDVSVTTCNAYDKLWNIKKSDVQNFISIGSTTVGDILTYPGNGNVVNGELQFLAPFYDSNSDGIYDVAQGDYPYINFSNSSVSCNNTLHGDQCLWWVFNDVGNVKTETGSAAIGIEVRAQAFAFVTNTKIDNCTFYQYQIINRTSYVLDSFYVGNYVDADLGNYNDDYVGCDVPRGLAYCYNGDADDGSGTAAGYGLNPPAIGVDFIGGPLADANDGIDNNFDGTTDEPNEKISMARFITYNGGLGAFGNPQVADDYYGYLSGTWLNGQHWSHDLLYGFSLGFPFTNFIFPNGTDPIFSGDNWNEFSSGSAPGDRKFLTSVGSFTLQSGGVNYITTSVLWARDSLGGNMPSVGSLQQLDDLVQQFYDSCFNVSVVSQFEITASFIVSVSPNPFSHHTTFNFSSNKNSLLIFDTNGKLVFENNSITQKQFVLNRGSLKSGIYFYQVLDSRGKKSSGKLVVQ